MRGSPGRSALLVAALLAGLPGCGKKGDPLPPLPRTPQPVSNLRVAQRGQEIEVSLTAPRATTGGGRLGVLQMEVLRADRPGDFAREALVSARAAAPGESLTQTEPLPPPGATIRYAARARADRHLSALSAVVTLVVQAPPPVPAVEGSLTPEGVKLGWAPLPMPSPSPSPSPSAAPPPASSPVPAAGPAPAAAPEPGALPSSPPTVVEPPAAAAGGPSPGPAAGPAPGPAPSGAEGPLPSPSGTPGGLRPGPPSPSPSPAGPQSGYHVYRREATGAYAQPQGPLLTAADFLDGSVAPGQSWCYVVRTVYALSPLVESAPSNELCFDVRDVAAPAAPTGVGVLDVDGALEVSWTASPDPDVKTYRVLRLGPRNRSTVLAEVAADQTRYRDLSAERGRPSVYAVVAVDAAGNASPPSEPAEGQLR